MTLDAAPINLRDHPGRPLGRALRVAIVGAGARGSVYAHLLDDSAGRAVVGAVAEPRDVIRQEFGSRHAIPQGAQFAHWRDLVVAPRSCDVVIISLHDSEHLDAATAFAAAGYDILLEKPMAPTLVECRRIVAAAEKADVWLGVCHVLRYTPYTSLVRSLVESGAIGDIVTVQHLEPVGFWHFAHSYVRGSWCREATSAPVLLTKSSHDIDWLSYIIGRPATRVSSFGSLLHFRPEHAPEGAGERCLDCAVEDACAYSAVRIYRRGLTPGLRESSFTAVVAPEYTEDALTDALRNGPYGRCVYGGQNDVADHQVVSIEYAGGVTAGFTLTAFSPVENRRTRIFGTKGQIATDGSTVELFDFRSGSTTLHEPVIGAASAGEGHAGGDVAMITAFVRALCDGEPIHFSSDGRTSLETHEIVFAAEEARLDGTVVSLAREVRGSPDLFDARLRLQATGATDGPLPVTALREAVDRAFFTDGHVHYRDMYAYTSKIHEALTTLRELLRDGHAEVVTALAEQAIDCAEDALGYVDDSDGYMSGIAEDLQGLHLDACQSRRPDPVALATTLFERELHSGDLDVFHGAAARYAEVLGKPGLAEYRRRAQITWDALPALGPGDEGSLDSPRFQITSMMRTLAEVAGDVDAAVDVLARDQSSPYQFVLIAQRLCDAGRYDDALAWAQKGLELFACEDSRLVDVATREYHRAGRGAAAVALAWRAYEERTAPAGYQRLSEQARLAGVWEDWRERALAKLRGQVETEIAAASRKKTGRLQPWAVCDASALVSVFLFEGDVDQAWSEAQAAGCSRSLWLELARLREQDHPSEVIPIWQSDVERAIDAKNNHAYAEAVATIARIRTLMVAAGHEETFPPYTAKLRARHKAKRNLMKLFDQHHW